MPREFDTVLDVALLAEKLWALRENLDFDEHLASYEKQTFTLIDLKEDGKDDVGNQVHRVCDWAPPPTSSPPRSDTASP